METNWISVKDRLPKVVGSGELMGMPPSSRYVLAIHRTAGWITETKVLICCYIKSTKTWESHFNEKIEDVTHWIELPK